LKLKYAELFSSFALNFNLRRYSKGVAHCPDPAKDGRIIVRLTDGEEVRLRLIFLWVGDSGFGRGSDSGGFGWIPSSPAGELFAVFYSLYGHFDPTEMDSGFGRIRSRVGFGWIPGSRNPNPPPNQDFLLQTRGSVVGP